MSARLQIRVRPRAHANEVVLAEDGQLRVYVTAAPDKGRANIAVVTLLAKALGVAKSAISIEHGHTSRDKMVAVEGLSRTEVLARLSSDK